MVFSFPTRLLEYQDNDNGLEITKTRLLSGERVVRTPMSTLVIDRSGHVDKYPLDVVVQAEPHGYFLRFVSPAEARSMPVDVRGMVPAYIVPMR